VCVVLLCVFTFWVPCCDVHYDFRNNNKTHHVRFSFTFSCWYEGSCLIYVICVCLCIVGSVQLTYCVVLSSCCVPYVFSNVSFVFHYYRLFCFVDVHVLLLLLVCIYAYWCPTRFPYHTPFGSPNSITTSVTRGVGTRVQSFVVFILLNV
jgi:hypothetical protein